MSDKEFSERELITKALGDLGFDAAVVKYLDRCVGNILSRAAGRGQDWRAELFAHMEIVRHAADWLSSAIVDGDPWLARLGSDGFPLKISKIYSFDMLLRESDKAMLKKSQRAHGAITSDTDETVVMQLDEGYNIVRLDSRVALDEESGMMRHCVGQGAYDQHVEPGSKRSIFSLRDRFGQSHATLEIDVSSDTVLQVKGKQNRPPLPKYMEKISRFLSVNDYVNGIENIGFVHCADGLIHHVSRLPDGAVVLGDLYLKNAFAENGVTVFNGVHVNGDVIVHSDFFWVFVTEFSADGNVLVVGAKDMFVSSRCRFNGDLTFSGCSVQEFPSNFKVCGSLEMIETEADLPLGLNVGKDLSIIGRGITSISDDTSIGGNLLAFASELNSIGRHCSISGDAQLPHAFDDAKIGDAFSVGGHTVSEASFRAVLDGYDRPINDGRALSGRIGG